MPKVRYDGSVAETTFGNRWNRFDSQEANDVLNLDRWDVILLAVAGYVAVLTLTRLMARHRDRLVADLEQQVAAEQRRQNAAAQQANRSRRKQKQDAA